MITLRTRHADNAAFSRETSQVVAISHHKEFHELADHMVHLSKASDHTVVR